MAPSMVQRTRVANSWTVAPMACDSQPPLASLSTQQPAGQPTPLCSPSASWLYQYRGTALYTGTSRSVGLQHTYMSGSLLSDLAPALHCCPCRAISCQCGRAAFRRGPRRGVEPAGSRRGSAAGVRHERHIFNFMRSIYTYICAHNCSARASSTRESPPLSYIATAVARQPPGLGALSHASPQSVPELVWCHRWQQPCSRGWLYCWGPSWSLRPS